MNLASRETALPVMQKNPPRALMRYVVNPILRAVIRSPIGKRMAPLAVLGVRGRRSGKLLTFNACVHDVAGDELVFTDRPWRVNFRDAEVEVTQGRVTRRMRAELVSDRQLVGPMLAAAVEAYGPKKFNLVLADGARPTADDFAATGKSAIRLTPA